ncbi:MAG: class I SAM-dependent methyltransferase [Planctomycetales bacterium]|nr:class I SAM-dependent methyltransferase [Planctomycetales bacterium]
MRIIMGKKHRDKILSFLRPGTRMLEWGAGGSTVWLAQNLPAGATLTSVEHDPKWFQKVQDHIGNAPHVRLLLREATGPLGANATIKEEDPRYLQSFVHALDGEQFDLIMVDGNARAACLRQAKDLLAPGGIVMLHDAQRAWYDEAKKNFAEYGHIGSCPDYPSPHLWWGGNSPLGEAVHASGELPLVICFYTKNTDYEIEARKLIASCERLQLDHRVVGLESRGSWEANCSLKSEFIYDIWKSSGRPILWVDADAVLHSSQELLRGCRADFAIHKCRGWQFASGTVFFNQTPAAATLIHRWIARCRQSPRVWDQENLDLAWEETVAVHPLETLWLPEPYCRIFDLHEGRSPAAGVIEHFQASRRLKAKVSTTPSIPGAPSTPALIAARQASRPRSWLLSPADGVTIKDSQNTPERPLTSLLKQMVDTYAQLQPPPGKVLALHDGLGAFWRLLQERGYETHTLAPSSEYLTSARDFCGDRIRLGAPTGLPFADASFDGAVGLGLLEFLPDAELDQALRELHRVVKSQIFLIIQTNPDPEDRWPQSARPRAWWTTKLLTAGFQETTPDKRRTGTDFLTNTTGMIACAFRKTHAEVAPPPRASRSFANRLSRMSRMSSWWRARSVNRKD